jgi:hypothetical protein
MKKMRITLKVKTTFCFATLEVVFIEYGEKFHPHASHI